MICFNTNAAPDSNATATLSEGGYNFTCVTPEENAEILSLLRSAAEYPADQRGIALAFFSEATNPSAGISVFDKTIKISPARKDRGTY